ncbi:MAG: EI24 domain-containing protein [Cetobacterium sp.]
MTKIKILFQSYLDAPKLIKILNLRWGYFIGGFVGVLLLLFFYWVSGHIGDWVFKEISNIFNFQEYSRLVRWMFIFLIRTVMISIEYFFFKTILLGILAPFFSYVSEKVETHENGKLYNFTFKENIYLVLRGVKIASKSFLKEMFYTTLVLLLGFVPVINIAVPVLIYIIQSYFISYNFVDYTLERHKFSAEKSSDFIWKNKVVFTIGGGIFTLIYFIPIIGIIVAPIISMVAFTTTTLKILKTEDVF